MAAKFKNEQDYTWFKTLEANGRYPVIANRIFDTYIDASNFLNSVTVIPGIAINPGTSVETVIEMLRIVDKVLVMSVNPGNAGQMYLPYVGQKIEQLLRLKQEMGFSLYWDGACGADKIKTFAPKGVDGFVLGTTLLFGKNRAYEEILKDIRELKL